MDAFNKLKEKKQERERLYEETMTKGINDYAHAVTLKAKLKQLLDDCGSQYPCGHSPDTVNALDELWEAICLCVPPDFIEEYEAIKAERLERAAEAVEEKVM